MRIVSANTKRVVYIVSSPERLFHNCHHALALTRTRKDSFRKLDLSAVAIERGGGKIDILLDGLSYLTMNDRVKSK
jgi:hypothetical protein